MNYIALLEARAMSTFSVKWLLIAVAYMALSMAALLNANEHWRHVFESISCLLLLTAALGASFSLGQRRSFWAGWLVFGIAWFVLVFGLFEFARGWRPRLITTGLTALHGRMFEPTIELFPYEEVQAALDRHNTVGGDVRTLPDKRHQVTFVRPRQSDFTAVGNAVLCIPFALLGAVIATWFWRKRESERG